MKILISILAIILVALLVVAFNINGVNNQNETPKDTETDIINAMVSLFFLVQLGKVALIIAGIVIVFFIIKWAIKKTCDYLAKRIASETHKEATEE